MTILEIPTVLTIVSKYYYIIVYWKLNGLLFF